MNGPRPALAVALLCVLAGACMPVQPTRERIELSTRAGRRIALMPEALTGIKALPLVNTKAGLEKHYGPGFVSLARVRVAPGTRVRGRHTVAAGPSRLTVYHISKDKGDGAPRTLRVLASGFHGAGGRAVFECTVRDLEESIFLVTSEKVDSATELNKHLTYMNGQDNEILVRGYSSNWCLSALKFKLSGRTEDNREEVFEKDARVLVGGLIRPQWVAFIRVDPGAAEPTRGPDE